MENKIKRKLNELKAIRIVKKSKYFDKKFYLKQNPDVLEVGIDPVVHYCLYGWKEGRNPSSQFDNNFYLNSNYKYNINMNPVVHYELYGKYNNEIIGPETKVKYRVSDMVKAHFAESKPLNAYMIDSEKRRLNVIFNDFDNGCFFGGKATALLLAINYVNTYNYGIRIVAQEPDERVFYQFLDLFELQKPVEVEFYAINGKSLLEVSPKDDFLCTMWSNADAVLNTPEITGKIYYIMQEVETFFYDHGDYHLRCFNTLTDNRLIPIVNSKLLYDYLVANNYNNVKKNGIYFEPVFSKKLLKPSSNSFKKKNKYKLFYYARPSHQRNIFYFGLDNLNEAFLSGKLDPKEWIVYTAGDKSVPEICFDSDVEVKKLGVMTWKEYCDFVSTVDLCYSMIYTPHPSYPPLDTTTAGSVCVTNNFANKQGLEKYSKNIISADLNKNDMIEALHKGAELAKNFQQRKKNYLESNTSGEWEVAFADSVKHMHSFIED